MKGKISLYSAMFFFLSACGSEHESKENLDTDTQDSLSGDSSTNDTVIQDELQMESEEYLLTKDNSVWQIDNYAESLLNHKITTPEKADRSGGDYLIYETIDLKGGFVAVTGAFEGRHEFALWRMKNGYDLIGWYTTGCGPVCAYDCKFYEREGEQGAEITETILPLDEMNAHRD